MRDITQETFQAVLFDNDGTLTDSRGAVLRAWTAWAEHHGITRAAFGNVHGMPSRRVVARVAPHLDLEPAVADIDRRELLDVEGVVALPGAAEALASTKGRSAIVTSATQELAVLRLDAAGLTAPEAFVTADDIIHGKPDPQPFQIAADRLGADPAHCLVVEDAPAGLQAGRAAGAGTLAVLTTSTPEELEPLADLVVEDLSDIVFTATEEGIRIGLG